MPGLLHGAAKYRFIIHRIPWSNRNAHTPFGVFTLLQLEIAQHFYNYCLAHKLSAKDVRGSAWGEATGF